MIFLLALLCTKFTAEVIVISEREILLVAFKSYITC
jgi:hypothetical protein